MDAQDCLTPQIGAFTVAVLLSVISSRVSYYYGHLSVVRRPSTVARFLMAGPIDLKLGGWVPWPKRVGLFFHFSILSLYVTTRGRY